VPDASGVFTYDFFSPTGFGGSGGFDDGVPGFVLTDEVPGLIDGAPMLIDGVPILTTGFSDESSGTLASSAEDGSAEVLLSAGTSADDRLSDVSEFPETPVPIPSQEARKINGISMNDNNIFLFIFPPLPNLRKNNYFNSIILFDRLCLYY
jgi:hypothetical protein